MTRKDFTAITAELRLTAAEATIVREALIHYSERAVSQTSHEASVAADVARRLVAAKPDGVK